METKEKSAGLRIDRQVYNQAMELKEKAKERGDPAAYSTMSWFSMLIMKGIDEMKKEVK